MNAMLPAAYQQQIIADMQPGDIGYAVPSAMYADESGYLWLNGSYLLHRDHCGTIQMRVERSERDGQWHVDARRCYYHLWTLGIPRYGSDFKPIPVATAKWK